MDLIRNNYLQKNSIKRALYEELNENLEMIKNLEDCKGKPKTVHIKELTIKLDEESFPLIERLLMVKTNQIEKELKEL